MRFFFYESCLRINIFFLHMNYSKYSSSLYETIISYENLVEYDIFLCENDCFGLRF